MGVVSRLSAIPSPAPRNTNGKQSRVLRDRVVGNPEARDIHRRAPPGLVRDGRGRRAVRLEIWQPAQGRRHSFGRAGGGALYLV